MSAEGRDLANAVTLVGLAAVGLTLILCGYPGGWILIFVVAGLA